MNAVKFILGTFLLSAVAASAQETTTPKVEVGLNYSWLHVNSANYDYQRTGNGGSGYIEYNLNRTVGLVADFGGYANTRTGINDKALTYLFGPRFNMRRFDRFTPYVQFLFGAAYAWSGPNGFQQNQNAFATAAGGGLDYNLSKHISIKPIQVEYVMTQFESANLGGSTKGFGDHQNDLRYSAGVVFKFGGK
ncbi:MAG TPA: outer membrane beta-barrel protein [Bryobacteraceae bacterium]|jgi:outer membrane immunogenic protein|nr:outer membrane beta-barrel protein [Bryobacteraceae bacterium]